MDQADSYRGNEDQPLVKIGTNRAELEALAAEIVRGEPIVHAEIEDLGALIKAVQEHRPDRVAKIGPDGRPTIEDPTKLEIHGGIVRSCDCTELEIGITLVASTRFAGEAVFSEASFAGEADFSRANFEGHAFFSRASFARNADFSGANFEGHAFFSEASFARTADFSRASFEGVVIFFGANFMGEWWLGARRNYLRKVMFAEKARRALEHHRPDVKRGLRWVHHRAWMRLTKLVIGATHVITRQFGWTTVRGIGQLGILTRVSLIALIAVPVLAGVGPALRVAVNRYNLAVTQAAVEFNHAAERLEAATNPMPDASAVDLVVEELRGWAAVWRDRFGGLTMDEPSLPDTLALAFFAAVCVTVGQLLYQVFAPQKVRGQDEDQFVEAIHTRYPEAAPDRNAGLRRATDALAAIAERRPDRHANLVGHHGDRVGIPPITRIGWFGDPQEEPTPQDGGNQGKGGEQQMKPFWETSPQGQGTIPGAERARIALEEGARAEYWLAGREKVGWAWGSFVLYAIAMLLLMTILVMQCYRVGKAAEWWAQSGPSSSSSAWIAPT